MLFWVVAVNRIRELLCCCIITVALHKPLFFFINTRLADCGVGRLLLCMESSAEQTMER